MGNEFGHDYKEWLYLYYDMIKKRGEVWVADCNMCDWNAEMDDEKSARMAFERHIKVAHGEPVTKVREDQQASPSQRQPNLPDPIALQGKKKRKQ